MAEQQHSLKDTIGAALQTATLSSTADWRTRLDLLDNLISGSQAAAAAVHHHSEMQKQDAKLRQRTKRARDGVRIAQEAGADVVSVYEMQAKLESADTERAELRKQKQLRACMLDANERKLLSAVRIAFPDLVAAGAVEAERELSLSLIRLFASKYA